MEQSTISGPFPLDRAMKTFALPLGLASPMWMAYGAAASVGATWWWMSRMTRFVAPSVARPIASNAVAIRVVETSAIAGETMPIAVAAEAMIASPEPVAAELAPSVVAEPALDRPDELTLLRGVGPRVADALVARGVTTFAQLASWSDDDMATFDQALKLLGRSKRYDFLGQARTLAEKG